MSVCPYVRAYMHACVHTYVLPSTKSFFDFHEIWYVDRVMHDCVHCDLIKGQGHEPFNVGNPAVFKSYLLCHLQWELATDHLIGPDF